MQRGKLVIVKIQVLLFLWRGFWKVVTVLSFFLWKISHKKWKIILVRKQRRCIWVFIWLPGIYWFIHSTYCCDNYTTQFIYYISIGSFVCVWWLFDINYCWWNTVMNKATFTFIKNISVTSSFVLLILSSLERPKIVQ